jgi:hypothetical protein
MTSLGRMKPAEYEERYEEALDIVRRKMADSMIGVPETARGAGRFVVIDGVPHDDEAIFSLAWSKETARVIAAQRRVVEQRRR